MDAIRAYARGKELDTATLRLAVRFALADFAQRHPGKTVEIRIPWIGAVQAIAGPVHRRGTPPNLVEMDGETWLRLVIGKEVAPEKITISGARADISGYLPIYRNLGSAD